MSARPLYVGIDLGTTNSVAAVFDGETLASIRNAEGGVLTPSVVRIDRRGNAVVGGKALRSDPLIRDRIGALAADLEVARQLQMQSLRAVEQGRAPIHEAAMAKVFASELQERLGQAALDILGSGGLLSEEADSAPLGEMEQFLRHSLMGIIAGGSNEIQRNIIAQRGLDLPRQ